MRSKYRELGELIEKVDIRNTDGSVNTLVGVSIEKCFIKSVANTIGTDLTKYKVIRRNEFAVSLMQVSRDEKIPVARLTEYDVAIMSPAYPIFKVKDERVILPEYLDMWFKRSEFDREASFIAVGGVRGSMPYEEFCRMKILVPSLEEQRRLVSDYQTITDRISLKQRINDNLEKQAESLYKEMLNNKDDWLKVSTLEEVSNIKTGKLNSEAAVLDGVYPFFTCSQETYRTNTFSFDQEAVLLAGNNASAIYPLKIFKGKFDAYQRTYVISSKNESVSNKQLYFMLKQQLNEFKGISSGTATKFLTMKILSPLPVVIARPDIAKTFYSATDKMFETIFQNDKEITNLKELRKIILTRLSNS